MTMYAIRDAEGQRLGSIIKIMGNPPQKRWVAYIADERSEGFPTLKAARAWIEEHGTPLKTRPR